MRNSVVYFIILLTIVVMAACLSIGDSANSEYFSSENEAIENGLTEEDTILSVEKYKDITLVFFERNGALGTSVLTEKEGRYKLIRETPLSGFEGDGDYLTGGFNIKIKNGKEINILTGKVFNSEINQILLEDNETKERIEIWSRELNSSTLFYYILGEEYISKKSVLTK